MNSLTLDESTVLEALRLVLDPELDCNIVDLGLIYDVTIRDRNVFVTMTLTTPGCPMHESLSWGVEAALRNLSEVEEVTVQVVWDPPWHPSMTSAEGRARLGLRNF